MSWPYKNTIQAQWPNFEKINFLLLHAIDLWIDEARRFTGSEKVRFHVNAGFATDGHSKDSQHYLGNAADGFLHIDNNPITLEVQAITAIRAGFTGIGLYPEWNTPGVHVDVRPIAFPEVKTIWVQRQGTYLQFTYDEWNRIVNRKKLT
jgi:hypothetical protein